MKYQFYAIILDLAGNQLSVGSSANVAGTFKTKIQKVTGISLNPSGSVTKNIGENFTITATVSPTDANDKTLNWNSTNKSVATVSSSGTVSCLAAGNTTISATAADGSGVKVEISLKVNDPLTSLTLDKDQTTLLYGAVTTTVNAITDPTNYDTNNIIWTIGDTSLATINTTKGKTVTITSNNNKKTGETTLTATAGGKSASMKVSIVNFTTTTYNYEGIIKEVLLPAGSYKFECWGAQGGGNYGGKGAYALSYYTFDVSMTIKILVGQQGSRATSTKNGNRPYGGGGGSFISTINNVPICIAGGGGGYDISNSSVVNGFNVLLPTNPDTRYYQNAQEGYGGYTCNGSCSSYYGGAGGGFYGDGNDSAGKSAGCGKAFINGGAGGGSGGGFGGGGGGDYECGGGGGYTGGYGGCGHSLVEGKGGGSYFIGSGSKSIQGSFSMPNVAGTGNEIGHLGNGAAKITPVN